MSLLTPSESRAFQSFLDAAAFPVDWSMQLEISHEHMPPAHGKEALTKATKDLMSLDGDNWRYPLGPYSLGESPRASVHTQQQAQTNPLTLSYSTRQQRSLATNADDTELANPLSTHLGSSNSHSQLAQLPFYHVMNSTADPKRTRADPHSYDHSSSSSSSRQSPVDLLTSSSTTARFSSSKAKRSPPPDGKLSNKRHRSSSHQNLLDEAQLLPQNKVVLLSSSQKKANHIQSEQKRRANIRRGYDTLCETIPALREACQAEDEQQLADGKPKGRRRGKGKAKVDDGEKIDGRAGPRSEYVVLSKTIDHLHELLSEREILMQRLQMARSALPVDHPLQHPQPDAPLPLWERKWTGGEKGDDDDDDDDDD
ncbi:hypothetical protein J3R82DRAFT_11757 [Butyriboletus roseoflavus]|nr:hypothetical protein J3R82DRAFT_11757 [Butyriboletus roseoflavus]